MLDIPFPWNTVDWPRVRSLFELSLGEPQPLDNVEGCLRDVTIPKELAEGGVGPSFGWGVATLLVLGLPDEQRVVDDEEVDEQEELRCLVDDLDHKTGACDTLIAGLEDMEPERIGGAYLFSASNPSSMCSGSWGLSVSFGKNRGYFIYSVEDAYDGNYGSNEYIVSVFEPMEPAVFHQACLRLYRDMYSALVLPPELGEQAEGTQPLWAECLEEVFRKSEYGRKELSGQLIESRII
jgi:hypothetical protein